jgi:hypothetical protein
MPLFNTPKSENYPRKWSKMSLDFKLMFVWQGFMMILFMTGSNFTIRQELSFAAILMAVLFSVSMKNRLLKGWHWQPVESRQGYPQWFASPHGNADGSYIRTRWRRLRYP